MSTSPINRRDFVRSTAAAGIAIGALPSLGSARPAAGAGPEVMIRSAVRPLVIADASGIQFKNGGPECAVERAFRLMTQGKDVLEALIAGVNIPELDPEETGIGYGALPNAEGVVQLDASCMHGPRRRAGAVAAIEGVRTPSLVAQAVMDQTDHHLLAGKGAQDFARALGFTVEADLNTEQSRRLWLEWRRRMDPDHWLDPSKRGIREKDKHEKDPGDTGLSALSRRDFGRRAVEAGWSMVKDGLIPEGTFWGTINCNGINANGDICGVTTTSGLAWKIPGRVGDSPILGAGLYVDNDVGAAGSTGRGEANLYSLASYQIVENMRLGMHPKDAMMEVCKRIAKNTVEKRLLNSRRLPNFDMDFYALDKQGRHAGVTFYAPGSYAICSANGAQTLPMDAVFSGKAAD